MSLLKWSLLPLALLFLSASASAQTAGAAGVFRAQLIDLHAKTILILERVEKAGPQGVTRQSTQEEIFALVRLVHRLEEEAGAANLQFIQRGQPSNKTLLLVQQAAKAVDGMLSSLDSYLESDDRAFLGFARDNNALAWSIRKVM